MAYIVGVDASGSYMLGCELIYLTYLCSVFWEAFDVWPFTHVNFICIRNCFKMDFASCIKSLSGTRESVMSL
jgi:hypothetical protein